MKKSSRPASNSEQAPQPAKIRPKLVKNLFDTVSPPNRTITNTDSSAIFGPRLGAVVIAPPPSPQDRFHLIAGDDVPLTSTLVVGTTAGGSVAIGATSPRSGLGASDLNPEMALVPGCAVVEGKSPLEEINLKTN